KELKSTIVFLRPLGLRLALITSLGWNAVNLLVWPALLVALALLWPVRRTRTLSR
ncbi:hypothetical protein, partial [Pseudomonas aeruginosa]|uniref:hypothetical protein n=1 Tax=Pseudomonas aeruginosa TaxID=287 RepID=UPI00301E4D09